MAITSVKLTAKVKNTNNEDKTFNIGYVNPDATDVILKTFVQKLNALTTNTLIGTEKTVVYDISAAEGE